MFQRQHAKCKLCNICNNNNIVIYTYTIWHAWPRKIIQKLSREQDIIYDLDFFLIELSVKVCYKKHVLCP